MICPFCLCETEPYDRYHERDHPACQEVQRLRRQLAQMSGVVETAGMGRFFHDPGEGDTKGPRA